MAADVQRWVLGRVRAHPALYRAVRRLGEAAGDRLPARQIPQIPGPVHRNDAMLTTGPAGAVSYARHGQDAVRFLGQVLGEDGWSAAAPVLDYGCGYGRVTRYLVDRVPSGQVAVHDTDPRAADFCRRAFATRQSSPGEEFGLIWLGSVLTHLPIPVGEALLKDLAARTRPEGIVAFSTHGRELVDRLDVFEPWVRQERGRLVEQLRSGPAYLPYPHHASYGLAWHPAGGVREIVAEAGLEVVACEPAGWLGGQDLWAAQRTAGTAVSGSS